MIRRIFIDTFRREQDLLTAEPPSPRFDRQTLIIFLWMPFALTFNKYFGDPKFVAGVLNDLSFHDLSLSLKIWLDHPMNGKFHHLAWWAITLDINYFLVPILLVKFVLRKNLPAFGLSMKNAFKDWWMYLVMLAIMIPLIAIFSQTSSFQARYPFYDPGHIHPDWHGLFLWELLYFSQFIALEFFFRGFVTLGLRHRFGYYSIFIMTVPYCMIHFGKPMPETIGAIFAGIILGTLSMKSRSVFLGIFIHYSIAIAMDLFSLWHKGML